MKKLILFVAMFGMVGFLSAQSCSKSKTAGNKACCAKTAAAAAKTASLDASIEKKVCANSGKISYYKSSTCPASGKVMQTEVRYDDKAKQFVNVAEVADEVPAEAKAKKECSKKCEKKCSKAKATGVSNETKACTKGNKACCKSKKGSKTAANASAKQTASKIN